MDSKNRQSVALFDEDSDIEYEDTSTKASLLPPAEVEGKSSDDQKPAKDKKVTPHDLFASTFAASESEDGDAPSENEDASAHNGQTRPHGGRGYTSKPISADLDEADSEIIRMREAGEPLNKIAYMLESKYKLKYFPKSIHSRYLRLKEALAAQKDEELALGLDTWHEGEDEALLAAYEKAHEVIEGEYKKLKSRRFIYTAKALAELKPSTNYSDKACKQRYSALIAGIAAIPPELDDDPEKRADELAENKIKWIEAQDQKLREGHEAEERARTVSSSTRQKWHEKLKGAVDRDHDRVIKEKERLLAQLVAKDRMIATLEQRQVKRAAKLEKMAAGKDKKNKKRPTVKEKEGKNKAALLKKVSGADNTSVATKTFSSPTVTRKRKAGAATDRSTRNKKRRILSNTESDSDTNDDDDSMGDDDSGEEYHPKTRQRRVAKVLKTTEDDGSTNEEA